MGFGTEFGALLAGIENYAGHLSGDAASMLVTAAWQGVILAGLLAIGLRLAPRTTAAYRFGLWSAGFVTIAGVPFLPALLHLSTATVAAGQAVAAEPAKVWLRLDPRWSIVLTVLWVCASMIRAGDLVVHSLRLRKLWKSAVPVKFDTAFPAAVIAGRTAELCTTRELEKPSVIGFLAPRILIPEWLLARLTPAELNQIVLHETEHLRRGDDWTNLIQKLVLVLFPLNPALIWIERRLCLEREMACDEGVVRRTHAPRAYAACLASLAERGLQHRTQALSLGAWQRRPELARRVHSLLLRKRALGPAAARGLAASLGCGLLAGSVALSLCRPMIDFSPAVTTAAAQTGVASESAGGGDRVYPAAYQAVAARMPLRGQARPYLTDLKATDLKATLPVRRTAFAAAATGSRKSISHPALSGQSSPTLPASKLAAAAPREELLKAELPSATLQPEPAPEQHAEQQWLVLTTWEQVQTTEPEPPATEASEQPAGEQPAPVSRQNSSQITVTRLILRIIPATSTSPTMPLRSGWLVFQL
jgi:beta-lactamase regulating signal transducer with metallopeptidase domain